MRIIAVANQKGGCGKTTTSINLSACLAALKKNVLLIDLDPQGHASLGLNIQPQDLSKTIYNVLTTDSEAKFRLDEVIIPISENLDLAPANILLSAIEQELSGKPEREAKLFQAISLMVSKKTYDYVIIDCSPSLGLLTFNGLRAATELIAPVDTGFFSLHGISRLLETVNLIDKRLNCQIKVKALITMFDSRTKFSHEVKDEIYKYFSGNVFETVIHNNVRVKESSSYGVPVAAYDKRCRGAQDYSALANEVESPMSKEKAKDKTSSASEKITSFIQEVQQVKKGTVVTFNSLDAKNVEIAGDFNNWVSSVDTKLERIDNGVWAKVIHLKPGAYKYKFVVDGQWITDPNNPKLEIDEVGNKNSILEVK
ncbi:MAG: AAA family ATPase [Candidatus Omnitrophota bacterium]